MATSHPLAVRRNPTRTSLAVATVLGLLAAHLVSFGVGVAAASPFDFEGSLTFRAFVDQDDPQPGDPLEAETRTSPFAVSGSQGNDIAIPGLLWLGEDGAPGDEPGQGLFHLSCSQTISGTYAIAQADNDLGYADGTRLQITSFSSTRLKNDGEQTSCDDTTFVSLELDKAVSSTEVAPGDTFAYTLTVRNAASGDRSVTADGVVVTDAIPTPFEIEALPEACALGGEADRVVSCDAGNLDPGQSRSFSIDVSVPDPLDGAFCEAIDNRGEATAEGPTPLAALSDMVSVTVTCDEAPTTRLTVAKLVVGPAPMTTDGAPVEFGFILSCGQAEPTVLPELEVEMSWAWMESFSLTGDQSASFDVPAEEDCTVEETVTHGASMTSWRLDDGAPNEGTRTATLQVSEGEERTVTFTNTFEETAATPTPAIDLVKTATDADVPFTVEDGTLVLDTSGQDVATVTYTYAITNIGEEALVSLTLVDDLIGDLSGDLDGLELAVGDTTTVTAAYAVTPEEIAAGLVTNVATTTAVGIVSGDPAEASDDETVFLVAVQEVVLTPPGDGPEPTATPTTEVPGAQLARTGVDAILLAAGGMLLALLGVSVVLAGRRDLRTKVR